MCHVNAREKQFNNNYNDPELWLIILVNIYTFLCMHVNTAIVYAEKKKIWALQSPWYKTTELCNDAQAGCFLSAQCSKCISIEQI